MNHPAADHAEGGAGAGRKRRHRKRRGKQPGHGPAGDLRGLRSPPSRRPGGDQSARPREAGGNATAEKHRARSGDKARMPEHARAGEPRSPDQARRPHPAGEGRRRSNGAEPGMRRESPLYAALDLGTNNCRLLIAEPQERGFRVVDAFSRIVRLGEGIGRSGRLSQPAMDRAVEALAVCRSKMADHNVHRMRLIATEACRAAENGVVFLERVRRETGLSLEIVDRKTEARLAVAGCVTLVDPYANGVLLFDIGGGSSELVWLDLRERGRARGFALTRYIRAWTSLPVGVVTLSERHGGVCVTREIFDQMVDEVSGMLDGFEGVEELGRLIEAGGMHMLGTSGTVTTLAGVHLGLKRYDRRKVDGIWLESNDVGSMIEQLLDMPFEARISNPCIGTDRADLVMAGCAILEAIRRRWPCQRLRVADRGLREGILVELMARDGVWRRRGPGHHQHGSQRPGGGRG
ncbi:Ppx/GppA phosphatase family protein [Hartmannibacter diazotrophicus]